MGVTGESFRFTENSTMGIKKKITAANLGDCQKVDLFNLTHIPVCCFVITA